MGASPWLSKYTIYVVFKTREDAECTKHFYISLCPRCTLWLIFELFHTKSVFSIIRHLFLDIRLHCLCSPCLPSCLIPQPAPGCSICGRRRRVLVGAAGGGYCCKNIQFMKCCITTDAKLRLECLCELCGEIKRKQTFNPCLMILIPASISSYALPPPTICTSCTHPAALLHQHTPIACVRS